VALAVDFTDARSQIDLPRGAEVLTGKAGTRIEGKQVRVE
jgi:hypothetical protein